MKPSIRGATPETRAPEGRGEGAPAVASDLLGPRWDVAIAVVATVIYVVVSQIQEKIGLCGGFGGDGCAYGLWALDFPARFAKRLDSYEIQRALPSLLAWAALKGLGIRRTNASVIHAFEALNGVLIFVGVTAWTKIARELRIRRVAMLVGTVAMFGSYGILKNTTYYSVIGDVWGFALGFVSLYAYLRRKAALLVLTAIVAAFSWPSLLGIDAILLVLWDRGAPVLAPAPFKLNHVVGGAAALAWSIFTLHLAATKYWPLYVIPVERMPQLLRLSVLIAAAYFYFMLRRAADHRALYAPMTYLRGFLRPTGVIAVVLVVVLKVVQTRYSVPQPRGFEMWFFDTGWLSVQKPGIFFVAYVVYFGPLFLVLVLRWSAVCALLHRCGVGLAAVAVLASVFGADSEERHGYSFIAILMPFAIKVLDDIDLDAFSMRVFAVLCVFYTKLWITLPPDVPEPSWEFPAQTLYLSQGPWMSNMMYLVQGTFVVLTGIWLHRAIRRRESC